MNSVFLELRLCQAMGHVGEAESLTERFRSFMHRRGLATSPNCVCGADEQTADHVVSTCRIHHAPRGIRGL